MAMGPRGGVYGRLLRRGGEFGAIFTMVTPHGSVHVMGCAWCRPLDAEGMAKLREFEVATPRLYGGKLDHIIGHTVGLQP